MIARVDTPRRAVPALPERLPGPLGAGRLAAAGSCRSSAKASPAGSMLAPHWRWNSAAARHGQPGMQTRRSWQVFWPSCGCESVILDEAGCPPPTGWRRAETLTVFGLAPGRALPLPAADEALWAQLDLDREPAAMDVARALYPEDTARQEDLYSELCTKRIRGKALVWTLRQGREAVCTVGAYALANGQAYMACGQTAELLARQRHRRAAHRADGQRALPQRGSTRCSSCARNGCMFTPASALQSCGGMSRFAPRRRAGRAI